MKPLRILSVSAWLVAASLPALAVDTVSSDAPDLTAIRARIAAQDYSGAAADLNGMVEKGVESPDVYNLLGFSLRKSGDRTRALTYYQKALDFDPDHKGALEYLGELYVEMGDIDKAKVNEARLADLCPQGCEELEDLRAAIAAAPVKTN